MPSTSKILWHSNAPWVPTGYGNQTALFLPHLHKHYPELACSSFYGLEGAPVPWKGIRVLPGVGGTYGNEALPYHVAHFFGEPRDGIVFTLMDVWVLDPDMCSQLDMVCWCPVDHEPAPPKVISFFERSLAVPLAMSRFGEAMLADAGLDPLYVPHAVDTNIYRPIDRATARAAAGLDEDAFVVGMVAANKGNPSRKSFIAALQAFAEIRRKHENAMICLHTDLDGIWSAGVPLGPVIKALGIPEEAIKRIDPYTSFFEPFTPETMATLYSALDVLLAPSTGEGFGIPILEAAACGTPAIVTDFSAMPEVAGPAAWKIGGSRVWTAQQSWQTLPNVREIVDALEDCYRLTDSERQTRREAARSHGLGYDIETVMTEHMLPALERAQERFQTRTAPVELTLREAA